MQKYHKKWQKEFQRVWSSFDTPPDTPPDTPKVHHILKIEKIEVLQKCITFVFYVFGVRTRKGNFSGFFREVPKIRVDWYNDARHIEKLKFFDFQCGGLF